MNWSDFLCSLVSIQKDELKKIRMHQFKAIRQLFETM